MNIRVALEHTTSESDLQDILCLEAKSFSPTSQYTDAETYYRHHLARKESINVLARDKHFRIVGYLLLIPQAEAIECLLKDDPLLVPDTLCVYVDNMAIEPEIRTSLLGGRLFKRMALLAYKEVKSRGFKRWATHARTITGLNTAIKSLFKGKVITSRFIEHWSWVDNEPYDYIEVEVS